MKILNFGSLNIDHVYKVNSFLVAGETAASLDYVKNPGGKGLNQSVALARSGGNVYHAGFIGKEGEFLRELLKSENVDTSFLRTTENPTGHAIIQVDRNGENCILVYGGANKCITREFADEVIGSFEKGDILLMQNEISMIGYITELARKKGMKIVFNPSPVTEDIKGYPLEMIDMFILNEVEGAIISGESNPEKVLDSLIKKFPSAEFVLTLGSKGSVYGKGDIRITQKAYPAKAVDTTAAGDTFTGYLLSSLAKGLDVKDALDLASRASAIAVTVSGAARSIPRLEDVTEKA